MDKKYKILHLLEWFELGGGLEQVAAEIACNLDRQKYDVEVWCLNRGGKMVDFVRQRGVSVRVFNITSYYNPFNILELTKAFKAAKPDILHTHIYFASTIGRIAAKLAGVPICINHVHSTYWHYTRRNLFVERLLSHVTCKVICVSDNVRHFVIDHEKIDRSKVVVIYNGTSVSNGLSRHETRQAFNVAENEIIITAVGSLVENKGHKVLLKALSVLEQRKINFKCWIVGEGPMEAELKEYAKQLKLESKVVFWGVRNDVGKILSASDIFVLASIYREGMSIAVLEAMACGVPVIASRIGGIPEVIDDDKNGLLVTPGNPDALVKALEDFIFNSEKRQQCAQEAFQKFNVNFKTKIMIKNIEKLYEDCIEENHVKV
jgi:glycosyltransferase involved in cell wall biosynthesis